MRLLVWMMRSVTFTIQHIQQAPCNNAVKEFGSSHLGICFELPEKDWQQLELLRVLGVAGRY